MKTKQIELHKEYGGVKPSVAKFAHEEVIDELIEKTLKDANVKIENIDAIAVTIGPGLVISLLVGFKKAKELAKQYNKKSDMPSFVKFSCLFFARYTSIK